MGMMLARLGLYFLESTSTAGQQSLVRAGWNGLGAIRPSQVIVFYEEISVVTGICIIVGHANPYPQPSTILCLLSHVHRWSLWNLECKQEQVGSIYRDFYAVIAPLHSPPYEKRSSIELGQVQSKKRVSKRDRKATIDVNGVQ